MNTRSLPGRPVFTPCILSWLLVVGIFSGTAVGECSDGTVTLASQLYPGAQEDAIRLHRFDETHMSILDSVETSRLVNRLLSDASP